VRALRYRLFDSNQIITAKGNPNLLPLIQRKKKPGSARFFYSRDLYQHLVFACWCQTIFQNRKRKTDQDDECKYTDQQAGANNSGCRHNDYSVEVY
jgi:hypothetical protein